MTVITCLYPRLGSLNARVLTVSSEQDSLSMGSVSPPWMSGEDSYMLATVYTGSQLWPGVLKLAGTRDRGSWRQ